MTNFKLLNYNIHLLLVVCCCGPAVTGRSSIPSNPIGTDSQDICCLWLFFSWRSCASTRRSSSVYRCSEDLQRIRQRNMWDYKIRFHSIENEKKHNAKQQADVGSYGGNRKERVQSINESDEMYFTAILFHELGGRRLVSCRHAASGTSAKRTKSTGST